MPDLLAVPSQRAPKPCLSHPRSTFDTKSTYADFDTVYSMCGSRSAPTPTAKGPEMLLVLRVIKADLLQSCEIFGKMDPFVKVNRIDDDGKTREIAETATHWNGHKTPVWDHTCRAQAMTGFEQVEFIVIERNVVVSNTFCGSARVAVMDLLVGSSIQQSSAPTQANSFMGAAAVVHGGAQSINLYKKAAVVGTITVQASLVMSTELGREETTLTRVDPALFIDPVKRVGVSGGTAPFFELCFTGGDKSPNYYIGKDLCRAEGEVVFYEEAAHLSKSAGNGGMGPLLDFMFEYLGVLTCKVDGEAAEAPKELLVMRNLRDGSQSLRMLDIKIGQKTSSKNWRGKSRLRALRQDFIDGLTNSACEGFRLEGFDGPPPTLESMDPVLDIGRVGPIGNLTIGAKSGLRKKALRMMLQRTRASEMFMHFFDLHHTSFPEGLLAEFFSPTEVADLVLHEMVLRLTALAIACRAVLVPQKWVGSSVALGFDSGWVVPRSEERRLRSHVKVNIFDWGRSELNDPVRYQTFTKQEQADRTQFWKYYVGGVDRLAWEAARMYWHRFSNATSWAKVSIAIYDFDAGSSNDFIGQVEVPVEDTHGNKTVELSPQQSGNAALIRRGSDHMYVTYSMRYADTPAGSRLAGMWRLTLVEAKNLLAMDTWGTSDPFAVITAFSRKEAHVLTQQSSVIVKNLNPKWNETLDLPVAAGTDQLLEGLKAVSPGFENFSRPAAFFSDDGSSSSTDFITKNVDLWVEHLDKAAKSIKKFEKPHEISAKLYVDDQPALQPIATTIENEVVPYPPPNQSAEVGNAYSLTTNISARGVTNGLQAPQNSLQERALSLNELYQKNDTASGLLPSPSNVNTKIEPDLPFWQRCCSISCKKAPERM